MFNSLRSKSSNSNFFATDGASKPSGTEKRGLTDKEDASKDTQNIIQTNANREMQGNSKEIKDSAKAEDKKRNRKTMQPLQIPDTNSIQLSGILPFYSMIAHFFLLIRTSLQKTSFL